ncbi:hypothetical protein DPMN_141061 [Dreissena polymorpha]|uniref:Uncharacterized protein n=1 Tax=Dreissena polymorpha TaxID=45954 RepID=A0A9D4GCN9_DREPO|nr:hypothetical protein DPMN_141061 [Dreissena polymorpha]
MFIKERIQVLPLSPSILPFLLPTTLLPTLKPLDKPSAAPETPIGLREVAPRH